MNKILASCLGIAVAGALGALARFGIYQAFSRLTGTWFPFGTLVINVSGAFCLGWINSALSEATGSADTWRIILGVGFLGAYTTFSSMMFESDKMLGDAAYIRTATYLAGSLFLGLIAVRLGVIVGKNM